MIVDVHMHLGNILRPHGGSIIYQSIKMPTRFNIQRFEEDILKFNTGGVFKKFFERNDDKYTLSVQERACAATAENYKTLHLKQLKKFSSKIFSDDRVLCACMPISPYVTFEDLYQYSVSDNTILPFTSIDPNSDIEKILDLITAQMPKCFGLKLHPILQGIPFDSDLLYAVLDLFKTSTKPVLFHAGASRYYIGDERKYQFCDLDDPIAAKEMVRRYPQIPFIIGHAGIAEFDEWATQLSKFDNVFCDISVQSKKNIKKIIDIYGEDRVMFATDFPCVRTSCTINIICDALPTRIMDKVLFKTAKTILKIE